MNYPHTVTFETPAETRTPAGGFTYDFAAVAELTDLPARVIPVALGEGDDQADRMVIETDRFTIVVQGDRAIERDMRAQTSHLAEPLGVIRVQRPVLYGSQATNATIVEAERITAEGEAGS